MLAACAHLSGLTSPKGAPSIAARDHVDLDDATPCESRHADSRSCRQPIFCEVAFVDAVHRGVVPLEMSEEDAHTDDTIKAKSDTLQSSRKIIHCFLCLGFDTVWHGQGIVIWIGCKLARNEGPAIDFHHVAVGCDGLRRVCDH